MTREEYLQALKVAFASEYAFYLKAQNFHWNVEGMLFPAYHELFGSIYSEVGDNTDKFAEELRALGTYAPASFTKLSGLSVVTGQDEVPSLQSMLTELYMDAEKMADMHRANYKLADEQGDYGFANFLADRQDAFKKHCWMLRSSLK